MLAAIALAACSKEVSVNVSNGTDDLVFTATMEKMVSKAALNTTTWDVEWALDDEIAIVDNLGTKVIYTATPDASDPTNATFVRKAGESETLRRMESEAGRFAKELGIAVATAEAAVAAIADLRRDCPI